MDWPRVMARQELAQMPDITTIRVNPFENFTKITGDEWLVTGIRNYLANLLRAGENLRVLSGPTATYGMPAKGPDYDISGIFQHAAGKLRVFIRLSRKGGTGLLHQYEVLLSYPENREFFMGLAKAAEDIMKLLKEPYDKGVLSAVRDATASTRAYESYSKGTEVLRAYNVKATQRALKWFEDVKRIDYRSPLGYEGTIDTLTFLGFYHRQRREPYSTYYQRAQAEMTKMLKLARPAPLLMTRKKDKVVKKPKAKLPELKNHFILNNISYSEGLRAMQAGQLSAAADAFRKATELVSEDAISWYYLGTVEASQGNAAASQTALQRARSINPCI